MCNDIATIVDSHLQVQKKGTLAKKKKTNKKVKRQFNILGIVCSRFLLRVQLRLNTLMSIQ